MEEDFLTGLAAITPQTNNYKENPITPSKALPKFTDKGSVKPMSKQELDNYMLGGESLTRELYKAPTIDDRTSFKIGNDRYKGFSLTESLTENSLATEQLGAGTQSFLTTGFNDIKVGATNFLAMFGTSFTSIYDMLKEGSLIPGNGALTTKIGEWRNEIDKDNVNFQSKSQSDSPILSMVTTANGIGDLFRSTMFGVGAGAGLAVQAAAVTFATEGIGTMPTLANGVRNILQSSKVLSSVAESVAASGQALRAAKAASAINKGVGIAKGLAMHYIGAYGEAEFEAMESSENLKAQFEQQYFQTYNQLPTQAEFAKINDISQQAKDTRFVLNAGMLMISNYAMINAVTKPFGKVVRSQEEMASRGFKSVLDKTGIKIVKEIGDSKLSPDTNFRAKLMEFGSLKLIPYIKKVAADGTITWSEGFEEGYQYLVGNSTDNYFTNKYSRNNKKVEKDIISNSYKVLEQMNADKGSLVSTEGVKSILSGIVSGTGQQLFVSGKEKIQKYFKEKDARNKFEKENPGKEYVPPIDGYEANIPSEERALTNMLKKAINVKSITGVTPEAAIDILKTTSNINNLQNSVNTETANELLKYQAQFVNVYKGVTLGQTEILEDILDRQLSSATLEEFNELIGFTGVKALNESQKDAYIETTKKSIREVKKAVETIETAFTNPFKSSTLQYGFFEDVKESLAYHAFMAEKLMTLSQEKLASSSMLARDPYVSEMLEGKVDLINSELRALNSSLKTFSESETLGELSPESKKFKKETQEKREILLAFKEGLKNNLSLSENLQNLAKVKNFEYEKGDDAKALDLHIVNQKHKNHVETFRMLSYMNKDNIAEIYKEYHDKGYDSAEYLENYKDKYTEIVQEKEIEDLSKNNPAVAEIIKTEVKETGVTPEEAAAKVNSSMVKKTPEEIKEIDELFKNIRKSFDITEGDNYKNVSTGQLIDFGNITLVVTDFNEDTVSLAVKSYPNIPVFRYNSSTKQLETFEKYEKILQELDGRYSEFKDNPITDLEKAFIELMNFEASEEFDYTNADEQFFTKVIKSLLEEESIAAATGIIVTPDPIEVVKKAIRKNMKTFDSKLVEKIDELIKLLTTKTYEQRVKYLIENGIIDNVYGIDSGRPIIIANINGYKLPFYRSLLGTSGKTKDNWFPFFGYGKQWNTDKEQDWFIKGPLNEIENHYDTQVVRDLSKLFNSILDYDRSLDKVSVISGNPFTDNKVLELPNINKLLYLSDDSGISRSHPESFSKVYDILYEIDKSYHENSGINQRPSSTNQSTSTSSKTPSSAQSLVLTKLDILKENYKQAELIKENETNRGGYRLLGALYKRVSDVVKNIINFDNNSTITNAINGTVVGNYVDAVARDYFADNEVTFTVSNYNDSGFANIANEESFTEIVESLKVVHEEIKATHGDDIIIVTDQLLLSKTSSDYEGYEGFAGSPDMIVIDNKGDLHLYDFKNKLDKNGRVRISDLEKGFNGGKSYKEKWTNQQSVYAELLEESVGPVKSMQIIVIPTFYQKEDFTGNDLSKQKVLQFKPKPSELTISGPLFIMPLEKLSSSKLIELLKPIEEKKTLVVTSSKPTIFEPYLNTELLFLIEPGNKLGVDKVNSSELREFLELWNQEKIKLSDLELIDINPDTSVKPYSFPSFPKFILDLSQRNNYKGLVYTSSTGKKSIVYSFRNPEIISVKSDLINLLSKKSIKEIGDNVSLGNVLNVIKDRPTDMKIFLEETNSTEDTFKNTLPYYNAYKAWIDSGAIKEEISNFFDLTYEAHDYNQTTNLDKISLVNAQHLNVEINGKKFQGLVRQQNIWYYKQDSELIKINDSELLDELDKISLNEFEKNENEDSKKLFDGNVILIQVKSAAGVITNKFQYAYDVKPTSEEDASKAYEILINTEKTALEKVKEFESIFYHISPVQYKFKKDLQANGKGLAPNYKLILNKDESVSLQVTYPAGKKTVAISETILITPKTVQIIPAGSTESSTGRILKKKETADNTPKLTDFVVDERLFKTYVPVTFGKDLVLDEQEEKEESSFILPEDEETIEEIELFTPDEQIFSIRLNLEEVKIDLAKLKEAMLSYEDAFSDFITSNTFNRKRMLQDYGLDSGEGLASILAENNNDKSFPSQRKGLTLDKIVNKLIKDCNK